MSVVGGPGGWLEQEIERLYQQVHLAAIADPNKPYSYAEFEQSFSGLRYFAFERPQIIISQIAAARAGL